MEDGRVVRMDLFTALDDDWSYSTLQCYVGYDRYGNVVATVDVSRAKRSPWVARVLKVHGGYVQKRKCTRELYEEKVREGQRLAERYRPQPS